MAPHIEASGLSGRSRSCAGVEASVRDTGRVRQVRLGWTTHGALVVANILVLVAQLCCLCCIATTGAPEPDEMCRPNTPFVQPSPSNKMVEGVRESAGCGATRSPYLPQSKAKQRDPKVEARTFP